MVGEEKEGMVTTTYQLSQALAEESNFTSRPDKMKAPSITTTDEKHPIP